MTIIESFRNKYNNSPQHIRKELLKYDDAIKVLFDFTEPIFMDNVGDLEEIHRVELVYQSELCNKEYICEYIDGITVYFKYEDNVYINTLSSFKSNK